MILHWQNWLIVSLIFGIVFGRRRTSANILTLVGNFIPHSGPKRQMRYLVQALGTLAKAPV